MTARLELSDDVLRVSGALTVASVADADAELRRLLLTNPASDLRIDLSTVDRIDTGGAVWVRRLPVVAATLGRQIEVGHLPESLLGFYEAVAKASTEVVVESESESGAESGAEAQEPKQIEETAEGLLDRVGDRAFRDVNAALQFLYVMSDLTWATFTSLFQQRGMRRGSFVEQASIIGAQGLTIVTLVLFLVGGVSTLQAAAQLRQFGANVLVADLLAIGITRELGPLMTAIMIAGRSGSAFAAEIATMKFTEEIDALRTMAIDPLKLVAVPKMWAMLLSVPLLTIMADFVGLLGGTVTGVLSLDISPATFFNRVTNALLLKDIITGLIKSLSFAWVITIISVFRGLQFRGGAAGVGNATTSAVVSSIFAIIVLDLTWGLIFYLR
ncbi:MAG TPA: MlaE family lipid ABC transporter permease subunit [Candidatus Latescibacteria bacterium]|jgi:phospholipid/cholesterol/gamma-HCH transport system permease protein|nr:ABC transporter [Gemmatimonadota bacterium]HCV26413.1 ABC transporter [Candidatus Latescibacterota bacterium]HJN30446.1 MlaE family lipid ABC transporter permease subunit [Candidatus Latescibacterota bacterium]|tara:strand:+ start:3561 stop:4718 length:1158 start_codon:yes stop_codon:yes gene_type:complete